MAKTRGYIVNIFKMFIFIFFMIINILNSYSQQSILKTKIDINAKNQKLISVLNQISTKTNCFFTYNPEFVSEEKIINYKAKNISVETVLNNIIPNNELSYTVLDDHIIICKKENSSSLNNFSQLKNDSILEISGKILNNKTQKPIPFASVGIVNTTIGTISNENGAFNLKVHKKYLDSTFFAANISFKTYETKLKNIEQQKATFLLEENYVSIQEVIIRSRDPIVILNKAIENIRNNYYQKKSILNAFYREGVKKNNRILNFSEAVISTYKSPYKPKLFSEKIKVLKSRKIINTKYSDTLVVKIKNGLYSVLKLDIIKNLPDFLSNLENNNYSYKITDIVTFGDKYAYEINFKQKDNIQDVLFKGKIYVETESFAIISCDFEYNLNKIGSKPNFIVKKKFHSKSKTVAAKYHVSYRSFNNKYFLNHVRADLSFRIKKRKQLFYKKYKTFLETVIFDINTTKVSKFNKKEVEKRNNVFIDNHYSYDPNFWGERNFIKPEPSIEDAISKIKVKLNYNEQIKD